MQKYRQNMLAMMINISDWIVEHRLDSGILHNSPEPDVKDSIFINGNLARVLICSYELTGEDKYLHQAVCWCDNFVDSANAVTTSKGNKAYWWWDIGNRNLYLADTGTALHALFKAFPYVEEARRNKYLDAYEKFHLLVAEGTDNDPMNRGQGPSPGWIIREGEDAGALGVGYRKGRLETRAYTISTATAGAQAHSALYKLTNTQRYRDIALNAANWLLKEFNEDGFIPYRIEGTIDNDNFFQGIHYSLEGLLMCWLYLEDEKYNADLIRISPRLKKFILSHQNEFGYWGREREYDGQRTMFMVHFLDWYCRNVEDDADSKKAILKFLDYILNPENSERYGFGNLVRIQGFGGLLLASLLYPELDICHVNHTIPIAR